jgi:hypothetical protein
MEKGSFVIDIGVDPVPFCKRVVLQHLSRYDRRWVDFGVAEDDDRKSCHTTIPAETREDKP